MSERLDNRMERLIDESYDFQAGYDAAIKDIVRYFRRKAQSISDNPAVVDIAPEKTIPWSYADAIERGEAKGAANE